MSDDRAGPLIRSQIVPAFVARVGAAGLDAAALARRFELPDDVLSQRELVVPLRVVRELPEAAAELLGDPLVGLHTAVWLPRGAYGLLEFIVRSARDVRDAANRLVRHHRLFNDLTSLSLEERADETVLTHELPGDPVCVGRHAHELLMALMVRVLRESMSRSDWCPRRVTFAHPEPAASSELADYFGPARLEFGRGKNELAVTPADLDLPLQSADSALLAVLDEQAMRLIAATPKDGDALWARLREHVRVALRDGAPRLEAAAQELGTSPRTLQRRLEEAGTSFQALVEEVRRDLACMYVEGGGLSVGEMAFLLGYSERRAFVRAFKRWTGKTPSAYRQR